MCICSKDDCVARECFDRQRAQLLFFFSQSEIYFAIAFFPTNDMKIDESRKYELRKTFLLLLLGCVPSKEFFIQKQNLHAYKKFFFIFLADLFE